MSQADDWQGILAAVGRHRGRYRYYVYWVERILFKRLNHKSQLGEDPKLTRDFGPIGVFL